MLLETVLLSKHIFSTHHPSGFPLARLTSFSFVPVLSFCLKMAKNDQKHHFNQGFSTSQEKRHTSLSCLQLTIAKHSGNIRLHSGVCLLVVREKTGAGCMREALETWFFFLQFSWNKKHFVSSCGRGECGMFRDRESLLKAWNVSHNRGERACRIAEPCARKNSARKK